MIFACGAVYEKIQITSLMCLQTLKYFLGEFYSILYNIRVKTDV